MLKIVEGFPRFFGRYVLLTAFGRGGMGDVYLAKQRVGTGERLVVVKTLRGDLSADSEYVGRFMDEARVVTQLNHAHISQIYEAGTVGEDHFLTMEFIHGVNVKDFLVHAVSVGEAVDAGTALVIIDAVLDALAYAHRLRSPTTQVPLKVVHRDVSPANVMVGFEGDVKLIDFGLAESALKTEHTETRVVMGKVSYMSPEQARGDDVDGRCDQFAAAVMLYELCTGDRFYGEMNTHQIWQVVGIGGFVPRSWRMLPEPLRACLAVALDKDPQRRFADCDAFRAALDEIRSEHYPKASRSKLREKLARLYGTRIEDERQLIATFAELAPPDTDVVTDRDLPFALPSPSATEPHLTSPSAPAPGPGPARLAGALTKNPDVTLAQPENTISSGAVLPTLPSSSPERTLAYRPANSAGRMVGIISGVAAAAAVIAFVATRPNPTTTPAPPTTTTTTTTTTAPAPAPAPAPETPPAPPPAAPLTPEAPPPPPAATPKAPPAPAPAPPPKAPPAITTTTSPPAPPPTPAPAPQATTKPSSVAEMEHAIRTCPASVKVPDFVRTTALDRTKSLEHRETLLTLWSAKCSAAGTP